MEHRTLLGGLQYLPLARSRIRALQAAGLLYASERLLLPDGIVTVRIIPGHEFIRLEGDVQMYALGIESNRVVVRTKGTDSYGAWRVHSTFANAYSNPLDLTPTVKLSNNRFVALSPRSTDTPGSDALSTQYRFADGFGKSKPIYAGPQAPYLAGLFWSGLPSWIISTDGVPSAGAYLFSAVDLTGSGTADYRNIIWKCEHNDFSTAVLTAKPAMWAFTYSAAAHGGRELHTLMTDNVAYIGNGSFVYGLGGSSYQAGTRDADHKMVVIVADRFDTSTAYDVETELGAVYGTDDFALGSCCSIGGSMTMFSGYGTTDVFTFDSADGAMNRYFTSDIGWSTTRAAIMPMGTDSAAYWRYKPGTDAFNVDAQFVYTTNLGATWTAVPINARRRDGTSLTIDFCLGTTTVRKPVTKTGSTITSNGELITIFHVPGVGHTEFRSTDFGSTWTENGLVSAQPATSAVGLLFRHVLVGANGLSLTWG